MSDGRKDDTAKLRFDLLPDPSFAELLRVLAFGAARYGDDNWHQVPEWRRRYANATMRHALSILWGEDTDPDSGLSHGAHIACNGLFLDWFSRNRADGKGGELGRIPLDPRDDYEAQSRAARPVGGDGPVPLGESP